MAWNAFELDADEKAYSDLRERNRWGKQASIKTAKGGVGYGGIVESPMDIPGVRDLVKQALTRELAPYVDESGNITVEL